MSFSRYPVAFLMVMGVLAVPATLAQAQGQSRPGDSVQVPGAEGRQRPLLGKITAIRGGAMDIQKPNGEAVTVKLSDKTEYRKDREAVKLSDFKVGDFVLVRGEENDDHSVNAQLIATRSSAQGGGPGGGFFAGGPGSAMGTLGKDFVIGEVKAIDAPKLTVLRVDNVTQTLELNEETSLRKGRESVTMADIQVGDHVMARGALQGSVFVPKGVMVIGPEQWKRMQEMGMILQGDQGAAKAPASGEGAKPKPQEQPH